MARAGVSNSTLAVAVRLKLVPHPMPRAAAAGMLSVDGHCKTFDAGTNGYARSEGIGAATVREDACAGFSSLTKVSDGAVRHDGSAHELHSIDAVRLSRLGPVSVSPSGPPIAHPWVW